MNYGNAKVLEVLDYPKIQKISIGRGLTYSWWEVKVKYSSYEDEAITVLTFNTKEEALKVKKGYMFKG